MQGNGNGNDCDDGSGDDFRKRNVYGDDIRPRVGNDRRVREVDFWLNANANANAIWTEMIYVWP